MKIDHSPSIIKMDSFKDHRQTIFSGLEQWDSSKTKGATNDGFKELGFVQLTSNQATTQQFSKPHLFSPTKNKRSMSVEANQDESELRFLEDFKNYGQNVRINES